MKNIKHLAFAVLGLVILSSCSKKITAQREVQDDIYYSVSEDAALQKANRKKELTVKKEVEKKEEKTVVGATSIPAEGGYNNYSDGYYSSRIQRFHSPYTPQFYCNPFSYGMGFNSYSYSNGYYNPYNSYDYGYGYYGNYPNYNSYNGYYNPYSYNSYYSNPYYYNNYYRNPYSYTPSTNYTPTTTGSTTTSTTDKVNHPRTGTTNSNITNKAITTRPAFIKKENTPDTKIGNTDNTIISNSTTEQPVYNYTSERIQEPIKTESLIETKQPAVLHIKEDNYSRPTNSENLSKPSTNQVIESSNTPTRIYREDRRSFRNESQNNFSQPTNTQPVYTQPTYTQPTYTPPSNSGGSFHQDRGGSNNSGTVNRPRR
ncbi:MAG: hypothetical protein NTX03_00295 [Bacteroidetes bacterium]|nr:hypothetical protein [Bacteroidota bacterium]